MTLLGGDKIYTYRILVHLALALALAAAVVLWQRDFLSEVYLENQVTYVGWAINGGIVVLFVLGMVRLVQLFFRYAGEERAISRFVSNIHRAREPWDDVPATSIIGQRYRIVLELHARRAAINHSALAATLVAAETSHNSFPKFVNNVLILTGVFGTIVSLSIALLGASDMISAASEIGSLGTIIHGMSTALSTTMTAILAYLFFGYFYLKLTDTQSYVISRVEHVTMTVLLPRYQAEPEAVLKDFSDLIRAATALTQRFEEAQAQFTALAERIETSLEHYVGEIRHGRHALDDIRQLLRSGFRLPAGEE